MTFVRELMLPQVIWIGVLTLALGSDANLAFAQSDDSASANFSAAIEDLGSSTFQLRQRAYQTLVKGGDAAIETLEKAAVNGDSEVATRCVEALVEIAGDEECLPDVIAALERLAADPLSAVAKLAKIQADDLKLTDEERAIKALKSDGVRVFQRPDGRIYSISISHDRQLVWLQYLKQVNTVRIMGKDVTDAGIANLVKMPELSRLSILRSSISDQGLAELSKLAGLESLGLSGDFVSAKGLRELRRIATLKRLSFYSDINEPMMEALIDVKQLEHLYLGDAPLSERTVELLNQMVHLKRVRITISGTDEHDFSRIAEISVPTDLSISRVEDYSDDGWKAFRNTRLIGLTISRCPVTDRGLQHIGQIKMLEKLSIRDAPITDAGLEHLSNLKALGFLSLTDVDVTDEGVAKLRAALPNLTYISVRKQGAAVAQPAALILPRISFTTSSDSGRKNAHVRENLTAADIEQLKQEKNLGVVFLTRGKTTDTELAMLKEVPMHGVVISSIHVTDKGVEQLADHPTVESLSLWKSGITDKAMESIARIPSLNKLSIKESDISDEGISELIARLSRTEKIKSLNLFRCANMTNRGLKEIGKLKLLEYLYLSNCKGLNSEILKEISQLPNLKRLDIDEIQLDQRDLRHLTSLSKLETLGLSYSESNGKLSNDGLKLLSRVSSLKSLTIQHASIDDAGARELVKLKNLEQLGLSGAPISDSGVNALAVGLPNLTRLNLSNTFVTDEAMEQVGKLKQLEWLYLDGTEVGNDGLSKLDGLTKLEYIYMDNDNVTAEGHRRFREAHPATKIMMQ